VSEPTENEMRLARELHAAKAALAQATEEKLLAYSALEAAMELVDYYRKREAE
jgi:hypothetical protein